MLIVVFAVLHALHLRADFPNYSPWTFDWAKFTDEGWYGNAAIRAHLFGYWYVAGDFNPAVALPVLPFLEWLLFFVTGVTPEAARGLVVAFFFANLALSYLLVRSSGPRWAGLLAVTLMVTSAFLYCFSRLAILEPLLMTFTLGAMNLAVRLPRLAKPVRAAMMIGLLFTLMMLTKTTAVFLLPALVWALVLPLRHRLGEAVGCALAALGSFAFSYGLWMALVWRCGLLADYKYLFFVNAYPKPREFYWPVVSALWSLHGGLWIDHILFPLAGLIVAGAVLASFNKGVRGDTAASRAWRAWGRALLLDPVLGASVWAVAGYIFFMAIQDHPQPRYFAVVAFFCFIVIARGAEALLGRSMAKPVAQIRMAGWAVARIAGWAVIGVTGLATILNGAQQVNYALHPQYTFVNAAAQLAQYMDEHPNGKRLLVSISGDELSLVNHVPALCDDFVTPTATIPGLAEKLAYYQPGWYAAWNDLDPNTLVELHIHFSLEQVATFNAFDDPDRNQLLLFKLHPLPGGKARDPDEQNLQVPLPDDSISAADD